MPRLAPEVSVGLVLVVLGLGAAISLLAALRAQRRAGQLPFYALRRRASSRVNRYLYAAGAFFLTSVFVTLFGRQILGQTAATIAPPIFPTGNRLVPTSVTTNPVVETRLPEAAATLTFSATPTDTSPPTLTSGSPTRLPEAITFTPSATPTETGTPQLPVALVTPILSPTITPPAEAVVGPLSITPLFDYPARRASDYFDPSGKTLFAVFEYNNFAPGMQWSAVWYRDAAPIFIETLAWDGETGGWGFSELAYEQWPLGVYEVRIFAGDRWLRSKIFYIVEVLPTDTPPP